MFPEVQVADQAAQQGQKSVQTQQPRVGLTLTVQRPSKRRQHLGHSLPKQCQGLQQQPMLLEPHAVMSSIRGQRVQVREHLNKATEGCPHTQQGGAQQPKGPHLYKGLAVLAGASDNLQEVHFLGGSNAVARGTRIGATAPDVAVPRAAASANSATPRDVLPPHPRQPGSAYTKTFQQPPQTGL